MMQITNALDGRRIGSQALSLFLVVTILLSLIPASAVAQTPDDTSYNESWSKSVTNAGDAVIGPSGDVYVIQNNTAGVTRLDASDGTQVWQSDPRGFSTGGDTFYQVQQDGLSDKLSIAVNDDGIYALVNQDGSGVESLYMLNRSNGNMIDSVDIETSAGNIDLGNINAADGHVVVRASSGVHILTTTDNSISQKHVRGGTNPNARAVIDQYNSTYESIGGSEREIAKYNEGSPSKTWTTGTSYLNAADGADSLAVNVSGTDGEDSTVYAAENNGLVTALGSSANSFDGTLWSTDITSSGPATDVAHDNTRDVIVAGDSEGEIHVLNTSGADIQTIDFVSGSSQSMVAVDAQSSSTTNRIVGVSNLDNEVKYYTEIQSSVQSINLTIDDKTLLPGQSGSYAVSGNLSGGGSTDVTTSSNVFSDDTNVVSVDSVNTEIEYQGDGTTVVRANYTNATGTLLWDNETVQTDTPEISINLNSNPIQLGFTQNYTVTNTTFGTTTDVTSSVTVTSDDSSIVSVNNADANYTGENLGTANLTASDGSYSASVEVEVIEPTELSWANWQFLNGGERMIVILSDWTILYLFGSLIISAMIAYKLRSGRFGVVSFAGLGGAGWIIGFVPNYVALTMIVFLIFIGFLYQFTASPTSN